MIGVRLGLGFKKRKRRACVCEKERERGVMRGEVEEETYPWKEVKSTVTLIDVRIRSRRGQQEVQEELGSGREEWRKR